jgi:hypothetical protein
MGVDAVVDKSSAMYAGGRVAGKALDAAITATGVGGAVKGIAREGLKYGTKALIKEGAKRGGAVAAGYVAGAAGEKVTDVVADAAVESGAITQEEADTARAIASVGSKLAGYAGLLKGAQAKRESSQANKGPDKAVDKVKADLSKTKAKSRSGHRNAANKQMNERMTKDPKFRKKMEEEYGEDVYDRTSTSGKGRRNPKDTEWHHDTEDPSTMTLENKASHADIHKKEPIGGWSKFHKHKEQ